MNLRLDLVKFLIIAYNTYPLCLCKTIKILLYATFIENSIKQGVKEEISNMNDSHMQMFAKPIPTDLTTSFLI